MATMDWPRHLWLIRHGQSAGNVARDVAEESGAEMIDLDTRDADVPLSDLGKVQSQATAHWFESVEPPPEVFFASPFVRAYQTCKAIAHDDEICVDERLREKEFGILDRFTKRGILNKFPELAEQRRLVGKFYFRPPGGESWCDVILRLRSFVEVLRRDYAQRRVVVVSHQVIVNCLRYLLERLDEQRILDIDAQADVPNCSITEYEGAPEGMMLVRANFTGHLEQASAPITRASDKPAGPK
jgi:broad specificity phosphatase PhoE